MKINRIRDESGNKKGERERGLSAIKELLLAEKLVYLFLSVHVKSLVS